MPSILIYTVFETPGGLDLRPNPVFLRPEESILILSGYTGKITKGTDGSVMGEYITGSNDDPINLDDTIEIPDGSGGFITHTQEVDYYDLAGTKTTITTAAALFVALRSFYGFTNPSPDF